MMNSKEQAKKIYEICVDKAKSKDNKTLTYREVLDYLGYGPRVQGNAIKYGLQLTQIACKNEKLPETHIPDTSFNRQCEERD